MKFLHILSIGTRLGLSSALVLILTAAIVVIAQSGIAHLHDEIDTIVSEDWVKNKLATTALDNTRGSIARVFQIVRARSRCVTMSSSLPRQRRQVVGQDRRVLPQSLQAGLGHRDPGVLVQVGGHRVVGHQALRLGE